MQISRGISLRIVVLSDSHKRVDILKQALSYAKDISADLILHAGDIVKLEALQSLKESKIPYIVVFGNNDDNLKKYKSEFNIFHEPHYFNEVNLKNKNLEFINVDIKPLKFKLMHKPKDLKNDADIIIFGHTHDFLAFIKNDTFYLNPGEICARDNGIFEFAYFDIIQNSFLLHRVFKTDENENWSEQRVQIEKIKD